MAVNKPPQPQANMLLTCPLLSANSEYNKMCVQDRCAWYMKATRTCAVAVIAHESILEIKSLQNQTTKQESQKTE